MVAKSVKVPEFSTDRAYVGRVMAVDLTTGTVTTETPSEDDYRQYLGGYGLGAKALWDLVPKGADPLGPDNVLALYPGLLTGSAMWGQCWQASFKSPLTGGWGDAWGDGDFGGALKLAAWDGVIVRGRSEKPVTLVIDKSGGRLEDASLDWGNLTGQNEKELKARHGKSAAVLNIGPMGEALSSLACLCNDGGRRAGRGGAGAVMGSKNLKAIVAVPFLKLLGPVLKEEVSSLVDGLVVPAQEYLGAFGTAGAISGAVYSGLAPVRNWKGVGTEVLPVIDLMGMDSGTTLGSRVDHKYGCFRCPVACGALTVESPNPKFPYPKGTHRPEFEALASLGALSCVTDGDALIYASHLCSEFGMDAVSVGGAVAYAIESFIAGAIGLRDTEGVELKWGDPDSLIYLVRRIGERKLLGAMLSGGVAKAVRIIGSETAEFAVNIGGIEPSPMDPRRNPDLLAAYLLDAKPGDASQYRDGWSSPLVSEQQRDHAKYEGRGAHSVEASDYVHLLGATGVCHLVASVMSEVGLTSMVNSVTGWTLTDKDLRLVAARIAALRMAFEFREVGSPTKRNVSRRLTGMGEPHEGGPLGGVEVETATIVAEFLAAREWDPATGVPTAKKLKALGLGAVAAALA